MTNQNLIEKTYADFGQGNVPEILHAMSEDIIIDTPGPGIVPWARVRKGNACAMDFSSKLAAQPSLKNRCFEIDQPYMEIYGHLTNHETKILTNN